MAIKFKRIYDLRVDNDLTQKQIAKLLNITEDMYYNFEQGRSNFPLDKLELFTKLFKVSFDYITGLSNEKNYYKIPMDYNILKTRLKKIRKEFNLSQENVASIIGDKQTTYCNYETGYSKITISKLYLISKHYNVSIDYFLGKTNNKDIKKSISV